MLNKNTVENLNLKAVVRAFSINEEQCQYVTERISNMTSDVKEICKTQGCIQDYIANPKLIPELKKALSEVTEIMEQRGRTKKNLVHVRTMYEDNLRKKTRTIFGNLSDVSKNILKLLRQYINIATVLERYAFSSDYMKKMQSRFQDMTTGENFKKFGELINRLSNIEIGNNDICLSVVLGEAIGNISVDFVSVNGEDGIPGIKNAENPDTEVINSLTSVAVGDLCDYLDDVSALMTNELQEFCKSLMFYSFGVSFVEVLKERDIPFVYPEITEHGKSAIKNMYSIHLVAKGIQKIEPLYVVQNNFTLVYGANNTGKTCYVRGIALAYIFAQAGLPIPATGGALCPVSDILSHFAAGEKSLGRFEEELKSVDEILNMTTQGKLVIFNETFQSTVYEEIAKPFKDILDAMVEAGAHALVVTHNEPFISLCREDEGVKLLKMNERHEIEED